MEQNWQIPFSRKISSFQHLISQTFHSFNILLYLYKFVFDISYFYFLLLRQSVLLHFVLRRFPQAILILYQKVQGQNVERKCRKTKCESDKMSKAKSSLKKEERRRKILSCVIFFLSTFCLSTFCPSTYCLLMLCH